MSGSAPQHDRLQRSDSDLSLLLSDASSLSSAESDLPESSKKSNKKKKVLKKNKKSTSSSSSKKKSAPKATQQQYCICRRGYNGKEFMIECERCKEWFHGACIGLPVSANVNRYVCQSCEARIGSISGKKKPPQQRQRAGKTLLPPPPSTTPASNTQSTLSQTKKKPLIVLSIPKPPPATTATAAHIPTTIPTTAAQQLLQSITSQPSQNNMSLSNEDDEDLDDICVLCDGDCVCGVEQQAHSALSSVSSSTTAVSAEVPLTKTSTSGVADTAALNNLDLSPHQGTQHHQDIPDSSTQKQNQTKIIISLPKPTSSSSSSSKKNRTKKHTKKSKDGKDGGKNNQINLVIERDGFEDENTAVSSSSGNSDKKGKDKKKSPKKKSAAAAAAAAKGNNNKKKTTKKEELDTAPKMRKHKGKSPTVLTNILHNAVVPPLLKLELKSGGDDMPFNEKKKKKDAALYTGDEEEEVIVDDLDDLLETMSPLSDNVSNELVDGDNSLSENEEFFTDDSLGEDNHDIDSLLLSDVEEGSMTILMTSSGDEIDSGDDVDIEIEETQNIINEIEEDEDNRYSDDEVDNAVYVEDDYEDEEDEEEYYQQYYARINSRWSSTDEEEDEEDDNDEEFDYTTATAPQGEPDGSNVSAFVTLDGEGAGSSVYNGLTAAFIQALAATANTPNLTEAGSGSGAATPTFGSGEDYQQQIIFDLANTLAALSTTQASLQQDDSSALRRLSLPSSAVSAVRRMRGSRDYTTSESLRALSAITADDVSLMLEPIDESTNEMLVNNGVEDTNNTLNVEFNSNKDLQIPESSMNSNNNSHDSQYRDVHEQLIDILNNNNRTASTNNSPLISPTTPTIVNNSTNNAVAPTAHPLLSPSQHTTVMTTNVPLQPNYPSSIYSHSSTRQLLPKPSGSGSIVNDNTLLSATTSTFATPFLNAVNQELQQQNPGSNENSLSKRKAASDMNLSTEEDAADLKRSRTSRSNSFNITVPSSSSSFYNPTRITSFSTPASPTAAHSSATTMKTAVQEDEIDESAVSMDEFLDTSKLYAGSNSSRSPSPLPPIEDDPYSRDLSRWQRVPIGAFRLMRFKNKLWLDR